MSDATSDATEDTEAVPPEPLEFIVGSWNRFAVLQAVDSTPRTRDELRSLSGTSRPTLSRILSDLVDRGWVLRRNDEYTSTGLGTVVASEIQQLVENIETAETLGPVLEWLQTEQLGFDLALLTDATILEPHPQDRTRPMRELSERIESTDEMRIVATGVTYEVVKTICQAGTAGQIRLRCVLDENAIAGTKAEPDLAEMFAEMIEQGHCDAYRYEGEDELVDYNLMDDEVLFCGISEDGLPRSILVSGDDTVRSWAAFRFEQRKDESILIPAETFAQ